MAKFELLVSGLTYKGRFYRKGDVVDFGDDVDVKRLEDAGHIGPEGTVEKRAEEAEKAAEEAAEREAERKREDDEEDARRFAAAEKERTGEWDGEAKPATYPSVSAQDGPKLTGRPGPRPGNARRR